MKKKITLLTISLLLIFAMVALPGCGQNPVESTPVDSSSDMSVGDSSGVVSNTAPSGTSAHAAGTQEGSTTTLSASSGTSKTEANSTTGRPASVTTTKKKTVMMPTTTKGGYSSSGSIQGIAAPSSFSGRFMYKTSAGKELGIMVEQPLTKKYEKAPFVLQIIGGGWCAGTVEKHITGVFGRSEAVSLLNDGWGLVTISYRGIDNGERLPELVADIMDGIGYLQVYESVFKLDCKNIITCGGSAPGHLSLLLATAPKDILTKYCEYPVRAYRVIGCMSINGFGALYPIDGNYMYGDKVNDPYIPLFGSTYAEDPEIRKQYSPLTYISQTTPPLMLLYGTHDDTVDPKQTLTLKSVCDQKKASAELIKCQNGDHNLQSANGEAVTPGKTEYLAKFFAFAKTCYSQSNS